MARFIFKKDNEEIALDNLIPGPLKQSFHNISKTIANQLQSMRCEVHHFEPVVILKSHEENVTVSGFAVCCDEFASKVRNLINLPTGTIGSDFVIMKRESKYTDEG